MIGISYNEKLEILEVVYQGGITLSDILRYGSKFREIKNLPGNLKLLTDATEANYLFTDNEIPIVAEALKENTKYFESIKSAVVQVKPTETAKSMIMQQQNNPTNYTHKIFNTREAAISWLIYG